MQNYLWLIPALPLLGAIVNGLFGRRLSTAFVSALAISTVTVSSVLSVMAFFAVRLVAHGAPMVTSLGSWFAIDRYGVAMNFMVDPLSSVMILVVTIVSTLIHIYSVGYMKGDPGYHRYFAYLNLFVFAMLVLVMGDNLVLMFVGWEGVGLCSYLLIGFWFTDEEKAIAGKKAFVVNRIGDFGFLLGIILLFHYAGTVDFAGLREVAPHFDVAAGTLTVITLLLFLGACGKSAQIPLYVWLPDAMAGPTPVSALIHAATMVTAGVYMVCRLSFMFALAPVTMGVIAGIGTLTALFAATIGLAQNDIKKVLAYSTVSQLGYMFAAAGVAAFSAGMFHLVTHAFFKACLFMCAGSVIHALSGEQDIGKMGGLSAKLPDTRFTFLVSTIAIAGFPPLSGFFSKDEILWLAFTSRNPAIPGLNYAVWAGLAITAFLTALYMFRLYYMVFTGGYAGHAHPHESPKVMTWPLVILAAVTMVLGFIGLPAWLEHPVEKAFVAVHGLFSKAPWSYPNFGHFISSSFYAQGSNFGFAEFSHAAEIGFTLFSIGIAVAGWYTAKRLYAGRTSAVPERLAERAGGLYRGAVAKWYVDEIYDAIIVKPFWAVSRALHQLVDVFIIDTLMVNGPAYIAQGTGYVLKFWQNGNVQRYLAAILVGAGVVVYVLLKG
ncbi:MAG: NADH-quinone oxidoreductase subunit L [Deltaproteobacteria bacterium]|nr:NADH-quinone oxidoreductase subunit L [Deltaproteobacteria bacterium]